ncbi:MAG: ABC transporter permease [Actinomycetota bacterium]|nr:ABC transporter permease [Actinomycetota bacterium]
MSTRGLLIFIGRRLIAVVVLLTIVSFGVFSLLYLAPGSVEDALLGTRVASDQTRMEIRARYRLDEPFLTQYVIWAKGVLALDFGTSIRTGEPVLTAIADRSELTLALGGYGFLVALVMGIGLGVLAAMRNRKTTDRAVVSISVLGASAPAFVTGVFLLYVFAVELSWFPAFGQGEGLADRVWHLTLPALTLAFGGAALLIRFTRAGMLTALDQDYVTFARARGVTERRVLTGYALRNALIPVVTAATLLLAFMLTGAVLVEVTFALPGLGALLVDSVAFKDVPMVQGLTLLLGAVAILANLVTDVLYLFVDPRIRRAQGVQ